MTFVVGLLGWVLALAFAIGYIASWYAAERDRSSSITALAIVVVLFLASTLLEAAVGNVA